MGSSTSSASVHRYPLAIVDWASTIGFVRTLGLRPRTTIAHFDITISIAVAAPSISTPPQNGHRRRFAVRYPRRAGHIHRPESVFQPAVRCDCRCRRRCRSVAAIAVQESGREAQDPSAALVECGGSGVCRWRITLGAFALGYTNRAGTGFSRSSQFCGKQWNYPAGVSGIGWKIKYAEAAGPLRASFVHSATKSRASAWRCRPSLRRARVGDCCSWPAVESASPAAWVTESPVPACCWWPPWRSLPCHRRAVALLPARLRLPFPTGPIPALSAGGLRTHFSSFLAPVRDEIRVQQLD